MATDRGLATAARIGSSSAVVASSLNSDPTQSAPSLHGVLDKTAAAFLRLPGADVVWVAVRESDSQSAVIRWGRPSSKSLGKDLRIESGHGIGGEALVTHKTCTGTTEKQRLSSTETALFKGERLACVLVVPLVARDEAEGIVYVGTRKRSGCSTVQITAADELAREWGPRLRDWRRLDAAIRSWKDIASAGGKSVLDAGMRWGDSVGGAGASAVRRPLERE